MKLAQGQVWKKDDVYYWIVTWARMFIEYKELDSLDTREAPIQHVTKKEFCRLVKDAELVADNLRKLEED